MRHNLLGGDDYGYLDPIWKEKVMTTGAEFIKYKTWFDDRYWFSVDFSTGICQFYDNWRLHNGMESRLWGLEIVNKNFHNLGAMYVPRRPGSSDSGVLSFQIPALRLHPDEIKWLQQFQISNYYNAYGSYGVHDRLHGVAVEAAPYSNQTVFRSVSYDYQDGDNTRNICIKLASKTYYNMHIDYGCGVGGYTHSFVINKFPDDYKLLRYQARWFRNSNIRYYSGYIQAPNEWLGVVINVNTGTSQWSDSGSAIDLEFGKISEAVTKPDGTIEYPKKYYFTVTEHKGRTTRSSGRRHPFKAYINEDTLRLIWWIPGATPINR